ncbi:hypothetical protein D3C72_2142300 [compost metagenome]
MQRIERRIIPAGMKAQRLPGQVALSAGCALRFQTLEKPGPYDFQPLPRDRLAPVLLAIRSGIAEQESGCPHPPQGVFMLDIP